MKKSLKELRGVFNECALCGEDCSQRLHCIGPILFNRQCYNGCHESFSSDEAYRLHFHPKTGGCKFPGNIYILIEDAERVWYVDEERRERLRREGNRKRVR